MNHLDPRPSPRFPRSLALFVLAVLLVTTGCTEEAPVDPLAESASSEPSTTATAPETDVWLLELVREGDTLRADSPRNITDRPGYDNQPSFTPDGDLMFVQMEGERTDIWRWNSEAERSTRVTATPNQGEYSPTPIPETESGISYIRSPDDSSGRLWRMPQEGADAEIIFADIGPVGYHAWFDANYVALWRLQEPSLLQLVEVQTQATRTIATAVGRSPQSVPNRRAVSFTRATERGTLVEVYDLDLDSTDELAILPEGGDFHAWTPDGVLLSSAGSRVFAWQNGDWQQLVDLDHLGLTLSRLAISPDGSRLALVAEHAK